MISEMPKPCPHSGQLNPPAHDPLLLTVEEAMTALRLGRTSIFALLAAGDEANPGQHLKRVRIGRATRVTMASVLILAGERKAAVAEASEGAE